MYKWFSCWKMVTNLYQQPEQNEMLKNSRFLFTDDRRSIDQLSEMSEISVQWMKINKNVNLKHVVLERKWLNGPVRYWWWVMVLWLRSRKKATVKPMADAIDWALSKHFIWKFKEDYATVFVKIDEICGLTWTVFSAIATHLFPRLKRGMKRLTINDDVKKKTRKGVSVFTENDHKIFRTMESPIGQMYKV